jgi:uncharacterized protein (UPF0332 family)
MPKRPPVTELEFLQATQNQRDFRNKLTKLGLTAAELDIKEHAHFVGLRWLALASMHLREAKRGLKSKSRRTTYSRAYYASYNASKAVRYIATGSVSLKADDHQKASELPGDFPDPVAWGLKITKLYEQRLRADYDNWAGPRSPFTMKVGDSVKEAAAFLRICKKYLKDKHGLSS